MSMVIKTSTPLETIHFTPKRYRTISAKQGFADCCYRAAANAKVRCKAQNLPYDIDADYLGQLMAERGWRCALTRIDFEIPSGKYHPFAPSIDRKIPNLGYVRDNVRMVCMIVNFAMNKWGEEALRKLIHEAKI